MGYIMVIFLYSCEYIKNQLFFTLKVGEIYELHGVMIPRLTDDKPESLGIRRNLPKSPKE